MLLILFFLSDIFSVIVLDSRSMDLADLEWEFGGDADLQRN